MVWGLVLPTLPSVWVRSYSTFKEARSTMGASMCQTGETCRRALSGHVVDCSEVLAVCEAG